MVFFLVQSVSGERKKRINYGKRGKIIGTQKNGRVRGVKGKRDITNLFTLWIYDQAQLATYLINIIQDMHMPVCLTR